MGNKVVIKRNWLGKIVEVEVLIEEREPEDKPVLELLQTVEVIFNGNE